MHNSAMGQPTDSNASNTLAADRSVPAVPKRYDSGRMWKLCGVVLLACSGSVVAAPDDLPREVLLLAHFKERMRQVLSLVPNYTCLETIQRSVQYRHAKAFSPLDAVILEVSNLEGKELLAWPGARRFEEEDVSSFPSGGLMGSGVFASYAHTIFLHATTTIRYDGDEDIVGHTVARFDFHVPAIWSGYQIQAYGASAKVAITGSFWIDSASLELVRMEVRSDEVPAELGIERTVTVIDYARMRIGNSDVLLPQAGRLLMTLLSGEVHRNDIQFSHCHEYSAESAIRFDMPETPAPAPAPRVRKRDLPAGLTVPIELDTVIDSGTAHVGDPLRGHVTNDVRRKAKILIPKGAVVRGRIRGLERLHSPETALDLTIELAELEWENTSAEFYGELLPKSAEQVENLSLNTAILSGGVRGVPLPHPAATEEAPAPQIPGTGVLRMTGTRFHIPAGLRMNWRTLEPNRRRKSS